MATKQQISKIAATIVEFQEELSSLATVDGQWIIQHGKEAVSLFVKTIASRNETVTDNSEVIKSISFGVLIEESDGKAFISQAKKIFSCLIDKAFDHYNLNEYSVATPETLVDLYEISKGVNHCQMLDLLTKDLNRLVVTQAQIINFCEKHPDWLAQKGRGIYFVIKAHDQFFVVNTRSSGDGLCVDVMSMENISHRNIDKNTLIAVPIILGSYNHLVDCDSNPFTPEGWKVEEHIKGGRLKFDPAKFFLYLSERQKKGSVSGNDLRKELSNQQVMNANVLDYLLANTELIPKEWKGKRIFFWGTIYSDSDGSLYVRCLRWYGSRWVWRYYWLGGVFGSNSPAALAS